jgi:hypothetical protein
MRTLWKVVIVLLFLASLNVTAGWPALGTLEALGEQSLDGALQRTRASSVDGTLLIGSRPAPTGTFLSFHRNGRRWSTKTGAEGRFHIDLAEAGRYVVNLDSAEHLATAIITLDFTPGTNPVRLELPSGAIRLQARRVDGTPLTEPLQVHVSGQASLAGFLLPSEGPDTNLIGLGFGSYRIRGDSASGLVSDFADVMLSPDAPVATVALVLSEQKGILRVVDSRGSPIRGAQVRASAYMEESPPGSGSYALRRIPKGEELWISAEGFLPTCAFTVLPTMSVVLTAVGPHTATIRIAPPPRAPIGEVLGLPGSECPVPVSMLPFTQRKDADALVLDLKGLPALSLRYRPLAKAPFSVVSVPGPSVTVVPPTRQSP